MHKLKIKTIVALNNAIGVIRLRPADSTELGPISRALAYALARTSAHIKSVVEGVREMEKPGEQFNEYDRRRLGLCMARARKDAAGAPVVDKGFYVFDDPDGFEAELSALWAEYSDAIKEWEAAKAGARAKMEELEEVALHMVGEDQLPDPCPLAVLEGLEPMITFGAAQA